MKERACDVIVSVCVCVYRLPTVENSSPQAIDTILLIVFCILHRGVHRYNARTQDDR